MLVFLTVYLTVYALLNLYVFRWLKPAFDWHLRGSLFFAAFVAIMIGLTLIVKWCDRKDYFLLAQVSSVFAYTWMVIVMWIFTFGMLAEFWNLFIAVFSLHFHSLASLRLMPRVFAGLIAVLSCVLVAWGTVERQNIRLKTIYINTSKFPKGTPPLKVLQLSDLHLSPLVGKHHVDRVLRLIEQAKPDVLVCTGDMVDSQSDERMGDYAVRFALLASPTNRFAILGNHEFYSGVDSSLYFYKIAGFKVLREENVTINHNGTDMVIAGVDDSSGGRIGGECRSDENVALPHVANRPFTILLKHQPDTSRSIGRFDLQLSGHTHGGQVFPFHFYVWLFHPNFRGLHVLSDGSQLYTNPGIGTWGPPIRVFAPPEVTLFIIQPKE
jgi:hypothetical protein